MKLRTTIGESCAAVAVRDVHHEHSRKPSEEPFPRGEWQTDHLREADHPAGDRHKRHPRRAERTRQVRRLAPQHDDADADPCVNCLGDRKSTRLNSSHANISYAVFCLKKKKKKHKRDIVKRYKTS